MLTPDVGHLRALTSLRFVSALMIVVYHAPALMAWPWATSRPDMLLHGVSFFFVLSGFILTHVYAGSAPVAARPFLQARFARLWPIHALAILILAATVPTHSVTFDGPGLLDKWVVLVVNLALMHAIVPITAYVFSWNAVSWSISTEVFFYMAFP